MPTSRCLIAALAACLLCAPARAEERPPAPAPEAANAAVPSPNRMRVLIRSAMMALTHAVQTGNYTVLRDLATPSFQQLNTTAQLSSSFQSLNESRLDLSPVLLIEPQLRQKPQLMPDGQLRLSGQFPTKPQQINFDLAFQNVEGKWRLNGISVGTSPAPADKTAESEANSDAPKPQASQTTAAPSAKPVQARAASPAPETSKPRKPKATTAGVLTPPSRPREPEASAPAVTPAATRKRATPSRSTDPFSALSAPQ